MMPFEVISHKGLFYIRVWWFDPDTWPFWRVRYMGQFQQTPSRYLSEALTFTTRDSANRYLQEIILNPA